MVIDRIENRALYYGLGEDIRIALDYFATIGTEPLEREDRHIDHDVLIRVRPMTSRPIGECKFEAHRIYGDIHFVAYGEEQIGFCNVHEMKEISYDEAKDAVALEGTGQVVTLKQGEFMITFLEDAHMPCIAPGEPAPLGKMIAKIRMKGEEK